MSRLPLILWPIWIIRVKTSPIKMKIEGWTKPGEQWATQTHFKISVWPGEAGSLTVSYQQPGRRMSELILPNTKPKLLVSGEIKLLLQELNTGFKWALKLEKLTLNKHFIFKTLQSPFLLRIAKLKCTDYSGKNKCMKTSIFSPWCMLWLMDILIKCFIIF